MTKVKTISLQGKEYAQVSERVKEFRKDCPNGKIETTPLPQPDGQIIFKAFVLKDKANEHSPEATGHAWGKNSGVKAFEKLETIAVGRALALLGYAMDGEIASGEEMQDFLEYQEQKKQILIDEAEKKLNACKDLEQVATTWASLTGEQKKAVENLKNELKEKFSKESV